MSIILFSYPRILTSIQQYTLYSIHTCNNYFEKFNANDYEGCFNELVEVK